MTALEIKRGKKKRLNTETANKAEKSSCYFGGEKQCRAGSQLQTGNDLANHCWLTTTRTFQARSRNDRRRVNLADYVSIFSNELTVLGIIKYIVYFEKKNIGLSRFLGLIIVFYLTSAKKPQIRHLAGVCPSVLISINPSIRLSENYLLFFFVFRVAGFNQIWHTKFPSLKDC